MNEVHGYAAVERDVIAESKGGKVSPGRVCRELALIAKMHDAPELSRALDETCNEVNRSNARAGRMKRALQALLYSLHARPLFGGPHLTLEEAIAKANETLDADRDGGGRG